jgi:hypothetical protein
MARLLRCNLSKFGAFAEAFSMFEIDLDVRACHLVETKKALLAP